MLSSFFTLCCKVSKICILNRSGFSKAVRHLTRRMRPRGSLKRCLMEGSKRSDFIWSSRSPDLSLLVFFSEDIVKKMHTLIYATKCTRTSEVNWGLRSQHSKCNVRTGHCQLQVPDYWMHRPKQSFRYRQTKFSALEFSFRSSVFYALELKHII